jgi:hypothetical protein
MPSVTPERPFPGRWCRGGQHESFLILRNHAKPWPVVNFVNRRMYIWVSVLVALGLAWGGRKVYLAKKNLVYLDVRDMDVREVVKKCEWQTWELIVVNKDVRGKVTLSVRGVPLEEVLGMIGEQTSSRASAVYPIFSESKSFVNIRKIARGEITHNTGGWTNFVVAADRGGRGGRGGGFGGPGGPAGFGIDGIKTQDSPVTLDVSAKDLGFAALALSRAAQAQVVPEDGADALVSVQVTQVPLTDAVAKVAKQAKRKWDVFYTLQDSPDFFARGDFEDGGDRREGFGRRFREGDTNGFDTNRWAEMREQREAGREREMEARLATMTPEEKAKAEEQRAQFEQMRNASPEQRREMFEQMRNNPEMRQRMENRSISYLNNSTPEGRAERGRQQIERRARRQQQQSSRR